MCISTVKVHDDVVVFLVGLQFQSFSVRILFCYCRVNLDMLLKDVVKSSALDESCTFLGRMYISFRKFTVKAVLFAFYQRQWLVNVVLYVSALITSKAQPFESSVTS